MEIIRPYGGKLLPLLTSEEEANHWQARKDLKKIVLSSRELGDLMMMGIGGFSPLRGYMSHDDWKSVCAEMKMADGLFWPIPITLSTDAAESLKIGDQLLLLAADQTPMGLLDLEDKYRPDKQLEVKNVFGTDDIKHPGVASVFQHNETYLGGAVKVFSRGPLATEFPHLYLSPEETRKTFTKLGWQTIAAFQTRNPLHRAHEYLTKMALELCDGVLIHSLLGNLKAGDIPAKVRVQAIEALIEHYYVPGSVVNAGYPLDMRYAGPREALLHALFRQNYGCTHLIVGRDHAGVGSYYAPFAAHDIFSQTDSLDIQPLKMTTAFWCRKCDTMATERSCPHPAEDHLYLSGTRLRELLASNQKVPDHFSRPQVIEILKAYYQNL